MTEIPALVVYQPTALCPEPLYHLLVVLSRMTHRAPVARRVQNQKIRILLRAALALAFANKEITVVRKNAMANITMWRQQY